MKYLITGLVALIGCMPINAFAQDDVAAPDPHVAGYAIGQQFGMVLKDAGDLYDREALMKGFDDAIAGKEPAYDAQAIQEATMLFQRALMAKQQAAAADAAPIAAVHTYCGRAVGEGSASASPLVMRQTRAM